VLALGPTFVKFGQTTATRPDAVSPELCAELERLYDAVAPMTRAEVERALASARAARPALAAAAVDLDPVGTGSVACVYRATLPGGEEIALKLKRPDVDRRMACDLALIAAMARAGQRLPKLRGMPIADLFEYISAAIVGQLDFEREARHSELIRRVLAPIPDVVVPRLHPELSGPDCLVFEYLPGLDADTPDALPEPARERLGSIVMTAVHKLFFEDGLVHCDLHPGNLYVTRDQQVVILDAGYCVRLPDRVRRLIGEFFARLALRGDRARERRQCRRIDRRGRLRRGVRVARRARRRARQHVRHAKLRRRRVRPPAALRHLRRVRFRVPADVADGRRGDAPPGLARRRLPGGRRRACQRLTRHR